MAENKNNPIISITLVSFNRKEFTKYCIRSLHSSTIRNKFELIVVDNRSTDGSRYLLRRFYRRKLIDKLILNQTNLHLGRAINQGWVIANLNAKFLLWCNNDFFFMPGWLENLELVFNDLKIDFVNALYLEGLTRKKYLSGTPAVTPTGGKYIIPKLRRNKPDIGAAPVILQSVVKKYNIKLPIINFRKGYTGPGPPFYRQLNHLGLKGTRLDKPCLLLQETKYDNPKYQSYYQTVYGVRGMLHNLKIYQSRGYVKNIKNYYAGTKFLEK